MRSLKTFFTLTFLFAFAFQVSAQKSNKAFKLSTDDKTDILKQIFDNGFEKLIEDNGFAQCLTPVVSGEKIILIKTLEPNIFPRYIGEHRFKFLDKKGIESEIKSNNGDCYFELSDFQAKNSKTVKITLWRRMDVITNLNGKSLYPARWVYGKGFSYEATKNEKNWNIRFLGNTQIVS